MCGIVGCIATSNDVVPLLISSLKRLEYRGYDSAGIAVLENGGLTTVREVGKLTNLESALADSGLRSSVGLGHTRWATHGKPTQVNAHPHRDGSGRIVVVHNGIIENYRELRAALVEKGHRFLSDTDSEVIAHLIQEHDAGDPLEAVRLAVRELQGAYAIGVMNADHPGVLIGAKKDSPLIVGLGCGENMLASDVPAVLDRTDTVVFLDEGQIAQLTPEALRIIDLDGAEVAWSPTRITWTLSQAERGGFPHFMSKEIHEQPTVIADTLLGRLDEVEGEVKLEDFRIDPSVLERVERIHVIACGTSWHAGHVAKFHIEKFARTPVDVDYASEFRYREPVLEPDDLVIAISQSGETADTIAALRMAKGAGCRVIGICNVIGSTIDRLSDGVIMTHAGPEIGVASTKAFVGQLVASALLGLASGRVRGVLGRDDVRRYCAELRQLPQIIERVLRVEDAVKAVAERYAGAQDFLFIGRGINYPIALEGALKLKEISYIHAEGYPAGEMKHGPIALVDERMPIVAICTPSATYEKVLTNIEEARVRDAKIIAVAAMHDRRIDSIADDVLRVPEVSEELSPIVNVVPLQLLAYHIARIRGCDVDQPRNLAKSVTVE